jgi:hypothetical protein
MFGPARRRVSVEEMNPAFVERLPADDSSRNQVPAARQKKRPTSKNAAAALQEGLADPKPRPTVSKSVVDGRIVYGSLVTPKHVTRAQIAEAVKSVKKVKSKDASAS